MTKKSKTRKVRLVYLGRRMGSDEKVYHAFKLGSQEKYWLTAKHCLIGETYYAEQEEGTVRLAKRPEQADEKNTIVVSPEDMKVWIAEDMAVELRVSKKRAKAKAKRQRFKEVIDMIEPILKNLGYLERRYFVEALVMQAERRMK